MKPCSFAIFTLIHLALPHVASKKARFPAELVNHVLQVVLRETLDPYEYLTLDELMAEIRSFAPHDESRRMEAETREVLGMLQQTDHIHDFIKAVNALLSQRDEDSIAPACVIDRRSPLGQYIRRATLSFQKTPFEGMSKVQLRLARWCAGAAGSQDEAGLEVKPLDQMQETRTKAFEDYRAALASGDYTKTISSLQKFFAYQFPKQDRGLHQHALLNMASFHLQEEEFPACRRALGEAIKIARSAGDKSCLETCMSLLRRLDAAQPNHASTSSSAVAQPTFEDLSSLSALDQLWELKNALRLGDPVPTAFQRLYLAMGRQEADLHPAPPTAAESAAKRDKDKDKSGADDMGVRRPDVDEGAWHATTSILWGMLGEDTLQELHEDLTFTSPTLDPESRLTVVQSRALRLSRAGDYQSALKLLFLPSSVASLTLHQYRSWAASVWEILLLQARRKDQRDVLEFLAVVMGTDLPASEIDGEPDMDLSSTSGSKSRLTGRAKIEKELKRARMMLDVSQPTSAMPDVLSAMEVSRSLGLHGLHRLTVLMLADVSVDMGMADYAEGLADEVYGQVVISQDAELKGYASLTKARALIVRSAKSDNRAALLLASVPHLQTAAQHYTAISLYSSVLHALRLHATVLHTLGPEYEHDRDEVATDFARVEEEWERARGGIQVGADEEPEEGEGTLAESMHEVWECARGVMEVGVAISLGRV